METKPKRSYYVDWLRVLAVLALFPFHAGQVFNSYLFTFSLIALPNFLYLKSVKGRWVIEALKKVASKSYGIFLFFIPIAVIEVLLRRAYKPD